VTLQDDEDEDFPESVYTLKDGIPAKSTLIALRLESGFLHFFVIAPFACHIHFGIEKDRGTFDDFLKGHERALVEFYAPLPEVFQLKFLPSCSRSHRRSTAKAMVWTLPETGARIQPGSRCSSSLCLQNEINIFSQEHQFK
jgi:hypothetical protein